MRPCSPVPGLSGTTALSQSPSLPGTLLTQPGLGLVKPERSSVLFLSGCCGSDAKGWWEFQLRCAAFQPGQMHECMSCLWARAVSQRLVECSAHRDSDRCYCQVELPSSKCHELPEPIVSGGCGSVSENFWKRMCFSGQV